jgi:divinyl protochlorophyllide a 8-vinyl-reductase
MAAADLERGAHPSTEGAPQTPPGDDGPAQAGSKIGPNAITRLAEAVTALHGAKATQALFDAAGLARHLLDPPTEMVSEDDVIALHRAGRRLYGLDSFTPIARLAGELTGDYVLANRIPRPAQRLLKLLPAPLAARLLVRAIGAHAWTFVGSGVFAFAPQSGGLRLTIEDSPLARDAQAEQPVCTYYTATFERIFRVLVSPQTRIVETACAAAGAPHCEFDVRFAPKAKKEN